MTTIVTRAGKGSPLTNNEMDTNLTNLNTYKVEQTSTTGSAGLPAGTTAQRDGSPAVGYSRFNTTTGKNETWSGTAWVAGGGATGGNGDDVFYENGQTVNNNYTITTNKNALSAGPITVASGVSVTIPSGSNWVIL
jgi:hypothetical protein